MVKSLFNEILHPLSLKNYICILCPSFHFDIASPQNLFPESLAWSCVFRYHSAVRCSGLTDFSGIVT